MESLRCDGTFQGGALDNLDITRTLDVLIGSRTPVQTKDAQR